MSPLALERADGIATLALNQPASRNALSAEMKSALSAAVSELAADAGVKAIVLTGAGGVFCAGGDIRGMLKAHEAATPVEGWRGRMQDVQPLIRGLAELDKPLIAAVDGPAYGAGFSIALLADVVLASTRARFCMSFLRMGLVPDFGAMYTLPRVVGVQRAKELVLSAREVAADEAVALGIAMEQLAPDALLPRAQALARSFAAAPPMASALVKRAMGMSLATDLRRALDEEANHQALCFQSGYHRRAVDDFLNKRPAQFQWPAPAPRDGA